MRKKETMKFRKSIILLLLDFTFSLKHVTSVFIEHLVISHSNEVFQLEYRMQG